MYIYMYCHRGKALLRLVLILPPCFFMTLGAGRKRLLRLELSDTNVDEP